MAAPSGIGPARRAWAARLLAVAFLAGHLVVAHPAFAFPAPVQVYYVTLPETDALTVLHAINDDAVSPAYTYFSIAVAADGTYVYYDQWEDGYAADLANPTSAEIFSASNQDGVQIWGNGEADDGCAPNIDGVAFTCSDLADVLDAGDVMVPYNAVDIPRQVAGSYVQDNFTTVSYSRNDGNVNWVGDWTETNDDGSPSLGTIYVNSNDHLRFRESTVAGDSIDRGLAVTAGDPCARLSFTLGQSGIDLGEDRLAVQVSSDGGSSYTTLETFDSAADAGAKSYSVSGFASPNMRVRFTALDTLESGFGDGENWTIDTVRVEWNCSMPIRFDSRDRIGATKSIAMARAAWATGSGTLNAFGHEMYATADWGTAYEAPVGTNTSNDGDMFEYSALSIMASRDNTAVQVDADADGAYETNVLLGQGGSYLVTDTRQGARVRTTDADKPIQVLLVTGDVGSNYASRDMTLIPTSAYGSSYWSPVGVTNAGASPTRNTRLFLYNPSTNDPVYVTCEKYDSANPGTPIVSTLGPAAARATLTTDLVSGQGARCYASDGSGTATGAALFGVATVDTAGRDYDWSITLLPDGFLTTDALVGLGLGRDPTSGTNPDSNGSPLWVTAACASGSTYVYVDWDNDGDADPVDTDGDGTAESGTENGIEVRRLQSVRLFEPPLDVEPYDQTGARVWSRTASGVGYGGTPGCRLAVAWGEDPASVGVGAPGLDVGTTVPPLRLVETSKSLALTTDADGDGLLSPGDTACYEVAVFNAGAIAVSSVKVYDTIPDNTEYMADSTQKQVDGESWVSVPDGSGGAFPLDVAGGVELVPSGGSLAPGETFRVRFVVTLDLDIGYDEIDNCATVLTDGAASSSCVVSFVAGQDWGDLPDSYSTTRTTAGASHSLYPDGPDGDKLPDAYDGDPAIWLGSNVDRELNGQPGTEANGDDSASPPGGSDDEDGLTLINPGLWHEGQNGATFSVTFGGSCPDCSNSGFLVVWFDWDNDQVFGADEALVVGTVNWDADDPASLSQPFTTDVPVGGLSNDLRVRVRLFGADPGGAAGAFAGAQVNGEVEDYVYDDITIAVSLSYFRTEPLGAGVRFEWSTATEAGNVGFHIYGRQADGSWQRVNEDLLPSREGDSVEVVRYAYESEAGPADSYRIDDVDVFGRVVSHGPFEMGRTYGDAIAAPAVDWPSVASEHTAKVQRRQHERAETAARQSAAAAWAGHALLDGAAESQRADAKVVGPVKPAPAARWPTVELRVDADGVYRVTYEQLLAAGVDLRAAPSSIALTDGARAVPISLKTRSNKAFGPGDYLEFVGFAADTLYTHTNVYTLSANQALARRVASDSRRPPASAISTPHYMETARVERQRRYSFSSPLADPWYDERMLVYKTPKSWSFGFDAEGLVAGAAPPTLQVVLFGGTDFAATPDHHVRLRLNDVIVAEAVFDGLAERSLSVPLPEGLLQAAGNTLTVELPGDLGVEYDLVNLDSYAVVYPRAFEARSGALSFTAAGQAFQVMGLPRGEAIVYRQTGDGALARLSASMVCKTDGPCTARFAGSDRTATYHVASSGSVSSPTIAPSIPAVNVSDKPARLLVISHPDFLSGLAPLVAARTAQGWSVEVVDVEQIYRQFGDDALDPQAIRDYVAFAATRKQTRHVLLVGGDTYDYFDYLGLGSISFVPTLYSRTDPIVAYTPSDSLYADIDGDLAPEVAIGRLPVRTSAELAAVLQKILAYESKQYGRSAVFAADKLDGGVSFAAQSDAFADRLGPSWSVQRVYLDLMPLAAARRALVDAINGGAALTAYVGHSSLDRWSFSRLLQGSDAALLANSGKPTVVAQWGCWNTYFVSPAADSMAHRFLLEGDRGAAAVLGASTLTLTASEQALGASLIPRLVQPGVTVGDAIRSAKVDLARSDPGAADVLLGWTLLGDPTTVVDR